MNKFLFVMTCLSTSLSLSAYSDTHGVPDNWLVDAPEGAVMSFTSPDKQAACTFSASPNQFKKTDKASILSHVKSNRHKQIQLIEEATEGARTFLVSDDIYMNDNPERNLTYVVINSGESISLHKERDIYHQGSTWSVACNVAPWATNDSPHKRVINEIISGFSK